MNPDTRIVVARRFPLLGRPRPTCPSLPARIQEIADTAHASGPDTPDQLTEGAHMLNKAALIASDCGIPQLAKKLCWQHIEFYRTAERPLTVLHARYMLEPVLNLARLQLRADNGNRALGLLKEMYRAVTEHTDVIVEGQTLPLTDLIGAQHEHHKLREWVWLHLLGDGIRALVLAGRWDDAVTHAHTHRGIGLHLMEGRQATIIAHLMNGASASAREVLAAATPEQPWELQVASCLKVMCADADVGPTEEDVDAMLESLPVQPPLAGYAHFHAQLGLTVTMLAHGTHPTLARRLRAHIVDEVIQSQDGYAAREVLRHVDGHMTLSRQQHDALSELLTASGLGSGTIPGPLMRSLLRSARAATTTLTSGLSPARPVRGPGMCA